MTSAWKRLPWPSLAAAALILGVVSCGDDGGSTTPTTTPTTTVPPTTLASGRTILQGSTAVPARQLFFVDVVVPSAGRLDLTVDYTYPTSVMPVWLTDHQCSRQQFDEDSCDFLGKLPSVQAAKPRVLTVPSIGPGTYTMFVNNDNGTPEGTTQNDEVVTYKFVLTP